LTRKVYILDTSAIFAGITGSQLAPQCTVPEVIEEVKDLDSRRRVEIALSIRRLNVVHPEEKYVRKAIRQSKAIGTYDKLSNTDVKILALAIKFLNEGFTPIVLTDDYRLQYTLKRMNIEFHPVKTMGIKD